MAVIFWITCFVLCQYVIGAVLPINNTEMLVNNNIRIKRAESDNVLENLRKLQKDNQKRRCEQCRETPRCKNHGRCEPCTRICKDIEQLSTISQLPSQETLLGSQDITQENNTPELLQDSGRFYTVGLFGPGPKQDLLTKLLNIKKKENLDKLLVLAKAKSDNASQNENLSNQPIIIDTANIFGENQIKPEIHKVDANDKLEPGMELVDKIEQMIDFEKQNNKKSQINEEQMDVIIEQALSNKEEPESETETAQKASEDNHITTKRSVHNLQNNHINDKTIDTNTNQETEFIIQNIDEIKKDQIGTNIRSQKLMQLENDQMDAFPNDHRNIEEQVGAINSALLDEETQNNPQTNQDLQEIKQLTNNSEDTTENETLQLNPTNISYLLKNLQKQVENVADLVKQTCGRIQHQEVDKARENGNQQNINNAINELQKDTNVAIQNANKVTDGLVKGMQTEIDKRLEQESSMVNCTNGTSATKEGVSFLSRSNFANDAIPKDTAGSVINNIGEADSRNVENINKQLSDESVISDANRRRADTPTLTHNSNSDDFNNLEPKPLESPQTTTANIPMPHEHNQETTLDHPIPDSQHKDMKPDATVTENILHSINGKTDNANQETVQDSQVFDTNNQAKSAEVASKHEVNCTETPVFEQLQTDKLAFKSEDSTLASTNFLNINEPNFNQLSRSSQDLPEHVTVSTEKITTHTSQNHNNQEIPTNLNPTLQDQEDDSKETPSDSLTGIESLSHENTIPQNAVYASFPKAPFYPKKVLINPAPVAMQAPEEEKSAAANREAPQIQEFVMSDEDLEANDQNKPQIVQQIEASEQSIATTTQELLQSELAADDNNNEKTAAINRETQTQVILAPEEKTEKGTVVTLQESTETHNLQTTLPPPALEQRFGVLPEMETTTTTLNEHKLNTPAPVVSTALKRPKIPTSNPLTLFGKIIPQINDTELPCNKPNNKIYFMGNGMQLPLNLNKGNDGSLQLSVDVDSLCTTCKSCNHNLPNEKEIQEQDLEQQLSQPDFTSRQSNIVKRSPDLKMSLPLLSLANPTSKKMLIEDEPSNVINKSLQRINKNMKQYSERRLKLEKEFKVRNKNALENSEESIPQKRAVLVNNIIQWLKDLTTNIHSRK